MRKLFELILADEVNYFSLKTCVKEAVVLTCLICLSLYLTIFWVQKAFLHRYLIADATFMNALLFYSVITTGFPVIT